MNIIHFVPSLENFSGSSLREDSSLTTGLRECFIPSLVLHWSPLLIYLHVKHLHCNGSIRDKNKNKWEGCREDQCPSPSERHNESNITFWIFLAWKYQSLHFNTSILLWYIISGYKQLLPFGTVSLPSEILEMVQNWVIKSLALVFSPQDVGIKTWCPYTCPDLYANRIGSRIISIWRKTIRCIDQLFVRIEEINIRNLISLYTLLNFLCFFPSSELEPDWWYIFRVQFYATMWKLSFNFNGSGWLEMRRNVFAFLWLIFCCSVPFGGLTAMTWRLAALFPDDHKACRLPH